jgi:O-methyltransferase
MIGKILNKILDRLAVSRGAIHRNDRVGALHRAWGHIFTNHIKGDYVEFGIYQGASFIQSYLQYQSFHQWLAQQMHSEETWRREVAAEYIQNKVTFRGLDTFEGIPDNDEGNATFATKTFLCSLSEVKSRLSSSSIPENSYVLYKGLFSKTKDMLTKDLKKIAILNIDSDLYESARDALAISEPYLSVGSVLLMDDYNAFNADDLKGERRAFREFSSTSRFKFEKWFSYMYSGQAFLCVQERS